MKSQPGKKEPTGIAIRNEVWAAGKVPDMKSHNKEGLLEDIGVPTSATDKIEINTALGHAVNAHTTTPSQYENDEPPDTDSIVSISSSAALVMMKIAQLKHSSRPLTQTHPEHPNNSETTSHQSQKTRIS